MDGSWVPLISTVVAPLAALGGVALNAWLNGRSGRRADTRADARARFDEGKAHAAVALAVASDLDAKIKFEMMDPQKAIALDIPVEEMRRMSDAAVLVPQAEVREAVDLFIHCMERSDILGADGAFWTEPQVQEQLIYAVRSVLAAYSRGDGIDEFALSVLREKKGEVDAFFARAEEEWRKKLR